MGIDVVVQYATQQDLIPTENEINNWVAAVLRGRHDAVAVTVRIVDEQEGGELNQLWCKRPGPTNVLSFPSSGLEQIAPELLGDIVICAPIVINEAHEQKKAPLAHWAHMVVHGTLHLLGLDHIDESDAKDMEGMETGILGELGFPNPYE